MDSKLLSLKKVKKTMIYFIVIKVENSTSQMTSYSSGAAIISLVLITKLFLDVADKLTSHSIA